MSDSRPGNGLIAEVHEERIQRLEESSQRAAVQLTENGLKIDGLKTRLDETMASLDQRLSAGFTSIATTLDRLDGRFGVLETRTNEQQDHIDRLCADQRAKVKRVATMKKGLLALILAAGGAAAGEGGKWLWGLFGH